MSCRLFEKELAIKVHVFSDRFCQLVGIAYTTRASVDDYAVFDRGEIAAEGNVAGLDVNSDSCRLERPASGVYFFRRVAKQ
jgi:hypothetical protein